MKAGPIRIRKARQPRRHGHGRKWKGLLFVVFEQAGAYFPPKPGFECRGLGKLTRNSDRNVSIRKASSSSSSSRGPAKACVCVCEGSFQSILLNERAKDIYIEFFSSRRHLHSPGLSHPPSRTRQLEGCLSCRTANTHTHMSHPRSPGVVLPIKNISLPCQGSPENPNQTGSALCAAQN